MSPSATPTVRYHLELPGLGGPVVLVAEDVIAWVRGYATALNKQQHLEVIDSSAPEDTRRVQALQIGDAQGWFRYLYPEYPERIES